MDQAVIDSISKLCAMQDALSLAWNKNSSQSQERLKIPLYRSGFQIWIYTVLHNALSQFNMLLRLYEGKIGAANYYKN